MRVTGKHGFLISLAALAIGLAAGGQPAGAAPSTALLGDLFGPPPTPLRLPYDPTDPQQARGMRWASAEIQAVPIGMTRARMTRVLERAGGAYASRGTAPLTGVYSLRKCPYFKVSIEFAPVQKPRRDKLGRVWTPEDPKDVVTKVSPPYLQQVYCD